MRGVKPNIAPDRAPIATVPKPPAWLSKDAKAEWRRIMPLLIARRILTDTDLGVLESYCTAIGAVREAQAAISRDGLIIQTEKGPKRHPAFGVQNSAMTTARLCAAELGLTPVSRSRPAIREDDHEDESSDLGC